MGTVAVQAFNSAKEFGTGIANVSTLLDGTAEEAKEKAKSYGEEVKKLMKETGSEMKGLNDGLYQVISTFGDAPDTIKQLEIATKAATAGGAETKDAINLLGAVTKGYGDISAEASQKAADLAFTTAKLGVTSFPELAASMGKVIPLAGAMKVSQEELFGATATLTGVTGNTAEVVTQLRGTIQGFMQPSKEMAAALQAIGYENGQVAIESEGLGGILNKLKEHVGGNEIAFAGLFGSVEAKSAVLALTGSQAEALTEKTLAMKEATGAADEAFKKSQNTTEAYMKKIGASIEVVKINLGEKLLPVVNQLLDWVVENIPLISDFFEEAFNSIGDAVSSLIPIIEDIFTGLQPLFEGAFKIIVEVIKNFSDVVQKIFNGLKDFWEENGKEITEIITTAWESIWSTIEAIWNTLSEVAQSIFNSLQKFWDEWGDKIIASFKIAFETISSIFEAAFKVIEGVWKVFQGAFSGDWSQMWEGIKQTFSGIWDAIVAYFKGLGGIFNTIGKDIIAGMVNGIKEKVSYAVDAMKDVGNTIISVVKGIFKQNSPSKVFEEIFENNMLGAVSGIEKNKGKVTKSATDMSKETFSNAKIWIENYKNSSDYLASEEIKMWQSMSQKYSEVSKEKVEIDKNITKLKESVIKEQQEAEKKAFEESKKWIDTRKKLGLLSTEDEIEAWKRVQEKYEEGTEFRIQADISLHETQKRLTKEKEEAEKKSFEESKKWIETRKKLGLLSTEDEIEAWKRVQEKYEEGTELRIQADISLHETQKRLTKEKEEAEKKSFEESKKWIETRKKLGLLSTEDEIKAWERVQQSYIEGTEERKQADLALHEAKQRLTKEQEEQEKKSFQISKSLIETRKAFGLMSMTEEVEAWQEVQARYAEGTEIRKEADKSLYDAQKRLFEEQERIMEKMEEAENKYQKAVEDRAKAIYNSFGLFDELKKKEEVSTQTLSNNLSSQISELKDWSTNIHELSRRGIDEGLLAELRAMGPSANAQINALSRMTDTELTKYQNMWKEKHRLAKEMAVDELQNLKKETNTTINGLLTELQGTVSSKSNPVGEKMIQGVINGIQTKAFELTNVLRNSISSALNEANSMIANSNINLPSSNTKSNTKPYVPSSALQNIAMLAEGGTITKSGLAIVGERGPELLNLNAGAQVIPLPQNTNSPKVPEKVYVTVEIDKVAVGHAVAPIVSQDIAFDARGDIS